MKSKIGKKLSWKINVFLCNRLSLLPIKPKALLTCCVIFIITFLTYHQAIQGGFIWDDDTFLTQNHLIKAKDGLYRFWFTTEPYDYFPLTYSILWIEWRLWGMNPIGYHAVNILIHCINSILVWLLIKKLKIPGAILTGLIFAVHPVNVESVAWITQLKNLLPMPFYLMTFLFYLEFEKTKKYLMYTISVLTFILALLAKPSVIMLPLILPGIVWWQKGRISCKDIIRSIPFWGISVLSAIATLWFQYNNAIGPEIVRTDGLLSRIVCSGWAIWFYLYKAIIPINLTFIYPRWSINTHSITAYIPILLLIIFTYFFWHFRKGWGRPFFAAIAYFVITLAPVLGFFDIYFMKYSFVADHWQYTAIIGVITIISGFLSILLSRYSKKLTYVISSVILLLLSVETWQQTMIYKNQETLWVDTILKNPSAWMAHYNLGTFLLEQKKYDEAIYHYYKTLESKTDHAKAHNNLGEAFFHLGRYDKAEIHFSRALQIEPGFIEANNNLKVILKIK